MREAETRARERLKALLRVAFALIMVLAGSLLGVLSQAQGDGWLVLQRIGLGLVVAGVVGLFTEFAFGPYWLNPPASRCPPGEGGLRMISPERQGFKGYHTWMLNLQAQDMFFAGRSVLHRMRADFEVRKFRPLHVSLVHKMASGSKIRVLFLNPMWMIIDQIATQEGRNNPEELYRDLKTTWEVVRDLRDELAKQKGGLRGSLDIRVYEQISQYAYHCVKDAATGAVEEMYVGFYFAELLGWRSALFEAQSEDVQSPFERHFSVLFADAKPVLTYSLGGGVRDFDQKFYDQVLAHLDEKTG